MDELAASVRRHPDIEDAFVASATNPHTGDHELRVYGVPSGSAKRWARTIGTATETLVTEMAERRGRLRNWRNFWDGLDDISVLVMARTLAQLGAFRTDEPASVRDVLKHCSVASDHEPLFRQWLRVLVDKGFLRVGPGKDEYVPAEELSTSELDTQVRKRLANLAVDGVERVFADYFASCVDEQVNLLRGETSPVSLLFPEGDSSLAESFYAQNPVSIVLNRVLAETVAATVRSSQDEPVRVLEVGAGTGATTTTVLQSLPAGRTRYCFTDVSPYFTDHARQRFAEYSFVDYAVLDLNADPDGQGFLPGSFDIIIGANVIHTAKRIDQALSGLRSLLKPGGTVFAVERTANTPVQMVTVGFLEGFSHYEDQRKGSNLPLLTADSWRQTLRDEGGFHRIAVVPRGVAATAELAEHVIIAERAAEDTQVDSPIALHDDLTELFGDTSFRYVPVERLPRDDNGSVDESGLTVLCGDEAQLPTVRS
ncbi:class I SAM-dependent methyltransferase [Saccharomonospora saliphila]|uniref:class I SAM-dependent methyltransferase n=1 Tax=Saccharomonospora saliphila TaxID=369829 RepID=UPI0012F9183F|nr:class I SAM-dependent methyltransferase [Saccharomonospora saliphila]